MNRRARIFSGLLALVAACGPTPGEPGDESGEPGTASTGAPEPTTGAPGPGTATSPTSATTAEPEPTTAGPETTGAPEPTTGEPVTCPEGQERLAPLWRTDIDILSQDLTAGVRGPLGRMSDGRIVLPAGLVVFAGPTGPGMLLVAPDGEFLGPAPTPGELVPGELYALRIGADDQPVLLTERNDDGEPTLAIHRFTTDGTPLAAFDLVAPKPKFVGAGFAALALADAPVIAGFDAALGGIALVKLMPDSGVPQWKTGLGGPDDLLPRLLAVGPDGSIAVGGVAGWDGGFRSLRVWRFAADGGALWSRELSLASFDDITGLSFAPGDQIVVLRGGGPSGGDPSHVTLLALAVADGATRWETIVAGPDGATGNPWANDLLVDADVLTIPISRNLTIDRDILVETRFVEVARVSLQGQAIDVVPVPGALAGPGVDTTRAVRGLCGELVLFSMDDHVDPRLEAFAP